MITDKERWQILSESAERPTWGSRNDVIIKYIEPSASVLDVGCGNRDIQKILDPSCDYQGLDCVGDETETIILDFNVINAAKLKLAKVYDYAICSGVLEYIVDPTSFIKFVKLNSTKIVLSYVLSQYRGKDNPNNGWVNNFSREELELLFKNNGLEIVNEDRYRTHAIFVLVPTTATTRRTATT